MGLITGSSEETWHPVMTSDTTLSSYWLNWRFFICATWVLISMTIALLLIWRKETCHEMEHGDQENKQEVTDESLFDDEAWMPCLKGTHPAWLLAFRVSAFLVLSVLLIVAVMVDGGSIFYYYTQWTFTSVTIYFGLGSFLSMRGCYQYHKRVSGDKVDNVEVDAEQGQSSPISMAIKNFSSHERPDLGQPAGKLVYVYQVLFQINAGAVMLTDCVFWFILVPFLTIKDYHLNALIVSMHSLNAVFLLGDTALSCLRFPWFRIAYFFLWTITYLLFQWMVHAFFRLWWPYPFLDLSSSFAPLWYFAVAVMHVPCYGAFAYIVKLKHTLFPRWFPESYQCMR